MAINYVAVSVNSARNMRRKLQALKRRNTDSLLGAALMTVRGTNKVTQADAVEWGNSFESLLTDKSMFAAVFKMPYELGSVVVLKGITRW